MQTLKTVRIKIRNDLTERELFSKLNAVLFTSGLDAEFMEIAGKKETVMCA